MNIVNDESAMLNADESIYSLVGIAFIHRRVAVE